jgi:hypothetical protein
MIQGKRLPQSPFSWRAAMVENNECRRPPGPMTVNTLPCMNAIVVIISRT